MDKVFSTRIIKKYRLHLISIIIEDENIKHNARYDEDLFEIVLPYVFCYKYTF